MRSPVTRATVAAAAIIMVAVLVGIILFGPTGITFAKAVEPILTAKTVILDFVLGGEDGPTMHEVVVGTRIRRTMSNMPNLTQILDLEAGKMLALDSESKTAVMVNIQGDVQEGTKNYVEFLRQVIRQVEDGRVEKLGQRRVDGQEAVGFVGKGRNEEVTIWADAKTGHPLRIEFTIGRDFRVVMKNFQFDVPLDAGLVSMDAPAGYTLRQTQLDMSGATEADFVESLRIWAEIIGDGAFPEAIGSEQTMKQIPLLVQKLIVRNIPEAEGVETGMKFGRGMLFHQMLEHRKCQWGYTGAGVKLGDAQKPVFWYQPQGSDTFRVIYGDLSIKDVAAENLPGSGAQ